MKVNDVISKERILENGFVFHCYFGNCIVFANETTLIFWSPINQTIRTICERRKL